MPEYHSDHGNWHAASGPKETCVKCGYVPPPVVKEVKPVQKKTTKESKKKVVSSANV